MSGSLLTRFQVGGPIARGTFRTSAVLAVRLLVQTGTLLIVARMLGPNAFGAFAGVAALAVMLGTASSFGTHLVLLSEVSRESSRSESVLRFAIPTTLICGAILFASYLATCILVIPRAEVPPAVLVALGIAETIVQPLVGLCASEHHGMGRIARAQLLGIIPAILRLFFAAAMILLKPEDPLESYTLGYLSASLLTLALIFIVLPTPWPPPNAWRLPTRSELRVAAGYAVLNITAAGPTELDKTLALRFLPLSTAGIYSAGARMIGATTLPVLAMLLSALPRLFREGQSPSNQSSRLLRLIFITSFTYGAVLATTLWVAAPLFDLLFGEKYIGLAHAIRCLAAAVPGMALRKAAGSALMSYGKPWMRVSFELIGILVLCIFATILTGQLGLAGMALALICSEWIMACSGTALIYFQTSMRSTGRKKR